MEGHDVPDVVPSDRKRLVLAYVERFTGDGITRADTERGRDVPNSPPQPRSRTVETSASIKELRARYDLTQEDLAKQVGV